MHILSRHLIAVLLCLVLPLQAGAALARAVAMVPLADTVKTTGMAGQDASLQAPVQVAHAIGAPHLHGAHAHHENLPRQKAETSSPAKPGAAPASPKAAPDSHKSKHAKGECPTCAKCCLLAAAAPPPAWAEASAIPVTRVGFAATQLSVPSFVPDGPERPPRSSLLA